MKSPIHPEIDLTKSELEPGLNSWHCQLSGGHWIPAPSYWKWHSQLPPVPKTERVNHEIPEIQHQDIEEQLERPALLCPESHCLLVRYKVGGIGIYIERSPMNGGIWLEAGEWNLLKKNGSHASLHEIFSTSYQKRILREEAHAALMHKFYSDLGEELAEDLTHFAEWLKLHPKKRRIIAWLHEQLALDEEDFASIPEDKIMETIVDNGNHST